MTNELELANEPIALRPMDARDSDFLFRLYASTRAEELSVVPWHDAEKEKFRRMQFNAQHTGYQQHYADPSYQIILSGDERIGRLYLSRGDNEFRIIDIALLPEHRGGGTGGGLMQQILDDSAAAGKPVRMHVKKNNPAMRLYDRRGFQQIGDVGVYWLMGWNST